MYENFSMEDEIEESIDRIKKRETYVDTETKKLDKRIRLVIRLAWITVGLGLLLLIVSIVKFVCLAHWNSETHIAAVAALWSLAGIFLIYVAFLGQKQQLLHQQLDIINSQLEVKYTRLELSGQKKEMKEQNNTLKKQRFENTFFQLISLFNSIVNALDIRDDNTQQVVASGRECFVEFYSRFKRNIVRIAKHTSPDQTKDDANIEQVLEAYQQLYDREKSDLSHYFRVIYRIFKFIDTSDVENKRHYASIARAQLSSHEQIMIFYNCLHDHGREKFKPLIERYAALKNLDWSLLISTADAGEYSRTAFGEN